MIAVKPPGWLSVPSRLGAEDERLCLGRVLETQLQKRLWPLHRLDLEVSGLILYALHAAAHRQASLWFEQRQIVKTYCALSIAAARDKFGSEPFKGTSFGTNSIMQGDPAAPLGGAQHFCWHSKILRGKKRAYESPVGKDAETHATLLGRRRLMIESTKTAQEPAELWQWTLSPHTGRAHQLRFDLARHGCPIVSDQLYGSSICLPNLPAPAIALACVALDFSACVGADRLELPQVFTEQQLLSVPTLTSWIRIRTKDRTSDQT